MLDTKKAQIGDIIQYKVQPWDIIGHIVNIFTLNRGYTHSAIYTGNGMKAEIKPGSQFKKIVIPKSEYKKIDVYRLKVPLSESEQKDILKAVDNLEGVGYDYLGLIATLRSTIGALFNWKKFRNFKPIFGIRNRFFCTEIVNRIYHDASANWKRGRVDLVPSVHEQATNPNDISRSRLLCKVC